MAEKLSMKIGVDDDEILAAQNVLLTFKNVGGDVFERTTEQAANLSAVLGTDMKSASMQLGKALNDPVKGMSKLGRSGVQFTEQQKKQVEAMVKAGASPAPRP